MFSWNTTIDDTSSIIDFRPYSEGPIENGWAGYFQGSNPQFATSSTAGDAGTGLSLHYTQFPGASMNLQFEGTAIYLYGTANCSYNVVLDSSSVDVPPYSSDGLLFYKDGLTPTSHSIQLTAQPNADSSEALAFDRAVFTNTVDEDATGIVPIVYQNWNTTLQYNGTWANDSGVAWIPNPDHPAPYMETNAFQSAVALNFTGGVAVAINAPRNWGHWTYDIHLDGTVSSYNCSTLWGIGDAVLFYQNGLDPSKEHQVSLVNTGSQSYYKLSLNSFTVYALNGSENAGSSTTSGGTPSSTSVGQPSAAAAASAKKTNVGVIVGPIVAALVVVALAVAAGLWWWRRRRPSTSAVYNPDLEPFPRNDRPEVWVKGQEAGFALPQVHEVVVPTVGKRAMMQGASTQPSAPSASSAPSAPASAAGSSSGGVSRTGGHSQQPSVVTSSIVPPTMTPMYSPPPPPPVDVNHIIELIAQRIDPRPHNPVDDAPPRYPMSPI